MTDEMISELIMYHELPYYFRSVSSTSELVLQNTTNKCSFIMF